MNRPNLKDLNQLEYLAQCLEKLAEENQSILLELQGMPIAYPGVGPVLAAMNAAVTQTNLARAALDARMLATAVREQLFGDDGEKEKAV